MSQSISITCPVEQSWLARQSAQREPSLHLFCPPRKSEQFLRKLFWCTNLDYDFFLLPKSNLQSSIKKKQLSNDIFLHIKVTTHFLCCTGCPAPRHTSQAPCMAFLWLQMSFLDQNYLGSTCHKLGKLKGNLVPGPRKTFAWIQGSPGQSGKPIKLISTKFDTM